MRVIPNLRRVGGKIFISLNEMTLAIKIIMEVTGSIWFVSQAV